MSNVIFTDGFDFYKSALLKWDAVAHGPSGGPTIVPSGGRNGLGCLDCGGSRNGGGNVVGIKAQKNISTITTLYMGFAFYFASGGGTSDSILVTWLDGGSTQVYLAMDSTGHFYFTRNGTLLGSKSTSAMTFNAWHYLEMKITIDPSAGVASLTVDGVSFLNLTAQNTRATSNSSLNSVVIGYNNITSGQGNVPFVLYDDLYLANSSNIGDVKITGLVPTGNGTTQNYTQNTTAWAASTQWWIGKTIKDSNGNVQVITSVTSDSKTGGSAPTWATIPGNTTTDSHVTWTCLGADSAWLEVAQNPPSLSGVRYGSTAYTVGTAVWDDNNNLQMCTTAGTSSGNNTPNGGAWNLTVGGTTTDGGATWTNMGQPEDCYLLSSTVGDVEEFTFPAVTGSAIKGVAVNMRARKDDVSTRSIRGYCLSSGVTADTGTDLPLSQTYAAYYWGIFENDPNTGSPFTVAAANAAQFGIKTTA